jgi:hypothetical protein
MLLSGIADLSLRRNGLDLGDMPRLDGITKHDAHDSILSYEPLVSRIRAGYNNVFRGRMPPLATP